MNYKDYPLVKLMKNIPLPIRQSYFNFHNEEAFWFNGEDRDFHKLESLVMNRTGLKRSGRSISLDTYLNFSDSKYSKDLRNLRIRQYKGEESGLTDLIALFEAEVGSENVFVVRINSQKQQTHTLRRIEKYLSNFLAIQESFLIEKVSKVYKYEDLRVKKLNLAGQYLNISFDEISSLVIDSKQVNPKKVFLSNLIVEVEYNNETDPELLRKVKNTLFENQIFLKYAAPKKYKKSVLVENWIKTN